ncbi:uncharacterized protein F5Z01DRAFT_641979 [Emericellopsis atlantica]|uniref:Uncharacterized protein n=1 Tax=Emericellopsis atlantica TaxID=2614577 RepID=A0A9P7ZWG0_9HYPO|nr:uncharacterized protein F5Z01DRAFT_641979 [Emericellopsis atlantica]KAG9258997.1 hypothetical protein F5Z01DRAFT_641979 [Emericellopsis atlantica]
MRPSHILAISSAIAVQANTLVPAQGVETTVAVEEYEPLTTHVRHAVPGNSTDIPAHPTAGVINVTGISTTTIAAPTGSGLPSIPDMGAFSQPMKSSMAGLLGFFIVGLVLL